jgi:putative drug exporter of the RND superfamily
VGAVEGEAALPVARMNDRSRSSQSETGSRLAWTASFVTRKPRLVVGIWILVVAALGFYGLDLSQRINTQLLFIDGTAAKRAHDIAIREFGGEDAMIVMLRGPRAEVERQGPELARQLGRVPRMQVVSPWTPGAAIDGLRASPGVAALVVRVDRRQDEEIKDLLPPVRRRVDRVVGGAVEASIAGLPAILEAYHEAGEHATAVGELIAFPILLVVLLFVFRSVLAAILPIVVGGAVLAATRGLLSLLIGIFPVDIFALTLAAMMGLALGVDYSLLVVSRFREELKSHDVADAARITVTRTARSVVPAGCGLMLAMLVTMLVLPSGAIAAMAVAVTVATAFSMLFALCVVPALLTLLGHNLDRWSLPRRDRTRAASLRWSRWIAARPRAVTAIMFGLLLSALWAFTLDSGVTTVELLPAGDPGRRQQEAVERALGPGWIAPMEVVVNGRNKPVTSPRRLRALADFQRRIERDPGVETVAGFTAIERGARRLTGVEDDLERQERGLDRLEKGLARAHDGAALNTSGLLAAAAGSRQLDAGVGTAGSGAGLLAEALDVASAGSVRLSSGLEQADEGSGKLAGGASKASSGASRLAEGLDRTREKTGEILGSARLFRNAMDTGNERLAELYPPLSATEDQLAAALGALQRMTTGRGDPEYATAVRAVEEASRQLGGTDPRTGEQADPSYEGIEAGIESAAGQFDVGRYLAARLEKTGGQARSGAIKLARGSAQLDRGLRRLAAGSQELSDGIEALSRGGERLPPSLARLGDGAQRLEQGLAQLGAGTTQLAGGLGGGAQKSKLLTGGLKKIGNGLRRGRVGDQGGGGLDHLRTSSPGLFRSGYFVLAGLDGSQPARRDQLSFLINLDRGGRAARMLVIPSDASSSVAARETKERLEEGAGELARETGAEVVLGGVAPNEIEVNRTFREQTPILRLALALVTFLVLVPVVRSLLLPLLAALLNLVTVSACFGLLSLLFNSSLLGGPGYIDAAVLPGTVIIIFGLAIDYEVFVFARMREEYVRTGSPSAAIKNGLDNTAHVVSGAAMIMIAVFLSFSISNFMPIRNFGVAQAIGVFLDAFVIRLVVLPAVMGRLGKWSWWLPSWLDRLLPGPKPAASTAPG